MAKMVISRKDKTDQFWSKLDAIQKWPKDHIFSLRGNRTYAWCRNRASGHRYKFNLEEWDAFELEHRVMTDPNSYIDPEVVIERSTGKVLASKGDAELVERLTKGIDVYTSEIGLWESNDYA